MKKFFFTPRIAPAFTLALLTLCLASPAAQAGLFHRRTVVVETPTVYVAPAPTIYAVPTSTVVAAPTPAVVTSPVVDSAVTATTYVPTVSSSVVTAPATTTYVPTVTTVPTVVVPARPVRVVYPRRVYLYGY